METGNQTGGPAGSQPIVMNPALIKLSYRQLIGPDARTPFEQAVFEDSYAELLMQAQRYNAGNRFTRLHDILAHDPKANSLHYKVGFAVGLYIQQLNRLIPGLTDTLGRVSIPFAQHAFSLVDSDLCSKRQHLVAITYTTDPILFFGSAGNTLILSSDHPSTAADDGWAATFLLPLHEGLTISEYQTAPATVHREQSSAYHTAPATT